MDEEEFEALIEKYGDCPEDLIKHARTPWQKLVAVEFFSFDKRLSTCEQSIDMIKKLLYAIFGVSILSFVAQLFLQFL